MIVLLLGGWLAWKVSASSRPAWLNDSLAWTRAHLVPPDRTTTIVASILLTGYLVVAAWWIAKARRRRSYDDGIAIFAALALVGLVGLAAAVLALGWYFRSSLTIQWTGLSVVGASIQIVIGLIVEGIKALRKRRALGN
jgi:hypothetical protein